MTSHDLPIEHIRLVLEREREQVRRREEFKNHVCLFRSDPRSLVPYCHTCGKPKP